MKLPPERRRKHVPYRASPEALAILQQFAGKARSHFIDEAITLTWKLVRARTPEDDIEVPPLLNSIPGYKES